MDPMRISLAHTLSRQWTLVLLRGVVAIVFGIVAFAQPAMSTMALVLLVGAFICFLPGPKPARSRRRQPDPEPALATAGDAR